MTGLYGRDQQLKQIMDSFHAMQSSGNSGVCIVTGYSGSGKTYLVREAMSRMTQEGALTTSAKFDQFSQDVPYTAIVTKPPSKTSHFPAILSPEKPPALPSPSLILMSCKQR